LRIAGSSSARASSAQRGAPAVRSAGSGAARFHQRGEEQPVVPPGAEGTHLVMAGVGNAEDVRQLAVEELVDACPRQAAERPRRHQPVLGEQAAGSGVAGQQLAIVAERQQVVAVDQHELARGIEAEDRPVAVQAQEVGVLDHPRVLLDQLQGKGLRVLRRRRIQRRDVEHRQQLTLRVEHRHRGAGEVGMPGAEMVVLVTGQRLLFLDAGADRTGAGMVLAPVRAEVEAGLAVGLLVGRVTEKLHGDAAAVGQQDDVAELGDMPVQLFDPGAGDGDQLVGLILVLAQHTPRHEARLGRARRVQPVVVHAAAPGAGDDRVTVTALLRCVGQRQHGLDMTGRRGEQRHASSSIPGTQAPGDLGDSSY